jgi:O-6-methylguanine DNA methyltransferase
MNNFAIYNTKVGYLRIGYEGDLIIYIKKSPFTKDENNNGEKTDYTESVYNQLLEYFDGKRKEFDFQYELRGTTFQKKVWNALCNIPYGETRSYKEIAIEIGNEKACRAVGMANNKNPITIVVPCHRVIGANGKLVGYGGGLDMKEQLLKLEKDNKYI